MSLAVLDETRLTITEAAQRLPGRKGHVTTQTLRRWAKVGVRAPGGGRVRLEAVRVGDTWHTSAEAVQRFIEATTARSVEDVPALGRSPAEASRAAAAASRELVRRGY